MTRLIKRAAQPHGMAKPRSRVSPAAPLARQSLRSRFYYNMSRKGAPVIMDIAKKYPSRVLDYHKELGLDPKVPIGNMSFCNLEDGRRLVSMRQFGYSIPDGSIKLKWFGKFLENRECHMMLVDAEFNFIDRYRCHGLSTCEDLRLMSFGEHVQACGTVADEDWRRHKIINLTLGIDGGDIIEVSRDVLPYVKEKNYMPIEGSEGLFISDMRDQSIDIISVSDPVKRMRSCVGMIPYRGSSQLLRYGDGYVCLVHRTTRDRRYYDAFAFFNDSLTECRISDEFAVFRDISPINFCCGMAIENDKAILPICVHDRETHLFELPIEDFLKTARPREVE